MVDGLAVSGCQRLKIRGKLKPFLPKEVSFTPDDYIIFYIILYFMIKLIDGDLDKN